MEELVRGGRLVLGPWYTLAEEFSISHEPLVRNLLYCRKTVEKYGGKAGSVAYTPASWGQTGQLPQILSQFGLDKMMFYRGILHHESDAETTRSKPGATTWNTTSATAPTSRPASHELPPHAPNFAHPPSLHPLSSVPPAAIMRMAEWLEELPKNLTRPRFVGLIPVGW